MTFDPILTLYEVTQSGKRAKSVQECLRISIRLVAPYAAKVPTNPKITSQTTSLMLKFAIFASINFKPMNYEVFIS